MKPVLSGHRIKRTPPIKRTVAEVPKFVSLIYLKLGYLKDSNAAAHSVDTGIS